MCLSSANIFIEAVKRLMSGLIGTPPELAVGAAGYTVLASTVMVKFALWAWCKLVIRSLDRGQTSSSVEAYAQVAEAQPYPLLPYAVV
jgi:predicted thioesterase